MKPCIDKTCGSHHPGWPNNCKAGPVEECGLYKPLTEKPDTGAKLACSDGLEAAALAKRFHETYEKLAPHYNYETRKKSAVPWDEVPENNKALMIATCASLLKQGL